MKKLYLLLIVALCAIPISFAQSSKSVSILGDSYSTFEGYIPPGNAGWYTTVPYHDTDVTSVTQTWWHRFIKESGYRLCVNNSFGGSTICHTGYNQEDYSDRSFIARMDNLGCPDILFIYGATNDSWANVPLGAYKYAGWTKEELYQFRPAMAYLLSHITERYINVDIYFLLNADLKPEIKEAVNTVCAHYNVPCIELTGLDLKSGHPSVKGMQQIYEQIKGRMDK
ncbi:MAG: SGNH/GDSL hydrolase family protein [Prevotellaceae bacterium]|jgi:hypothetical protein|nr:SGNH/GDSL hydrolase family protein [Prevotellaceae bacterium]